MAEKLIIKKFGPIEEVDLDITKLIVFIGPQSSGKSTIAKLLAIFRSIDIVLGEKKHLDGFQEYMLSNYFRGDDTYIKYSNPDYSAVYQNSTWTIHKESEFEEKLKKEQKRIEELIANVVTDRLKVVAENEKATMLKQFYQANWRNLFLLLKKQIYIPAERILTSIISESGFSFNDITLPGSLKQFGRQFESSRIRIKELKLESLNITYKYSEEGANKGYRIYFDDTHSISLSESSSGVQALLPIQIVVENLSSLDSGYSFIVEEPELNLFPTAQKGILNFLVRKANHKNDLVITTHSPYILSVLNNMIFAYTVSQRNGADSASIASIIPETNWINPAQFNAYYLDGGRARSIFDLQTKVIGDNELDGISLDISDERDQLIELYTRYN